MNPEARSNLCVPITDSGGRLAVTANHVSEMTGKIRLDAMATSVMIPAEISPARPARRPVNLGTSPSMPAMLATRERAMMITPTAPATITSGSKGRLSARPAMPPRRPLESGHTPPRQWCGRAAVAARQTR